MENVKELLSEIKSSISQQSSSVKDEQRVMKAMLNDKEYSVDVYGKEGKVGEYNPSLAVRDMMAGVISTTTRMSKAETSHLMDEYEFTKSDASTMVDLSKEFINTYAKTSRKIPLGGRETSNIELLPQNNKATTKHCPVKIGVDKDGKGIYDRKEVQIPAFDSIKVVPGAPSWVK